MARRRVRVLLVGSTARRRREIRTTLGLGQADAVVAGPDGGAVIAHHTGGRVEVFSCESDSWSPCGPVDAVICAVAAAEPTGVADVARHLAPLLASAGLAGAPLLVLAEDQDAPLAVPCWRVAEELGLHGSGRPWSVQGCCRAARARREGVLEGLQWLVQACGTEHDAAAQRGPPGVWLSRRRSPPRSAPAAPLARRAAWAPRVGQCGPHAPKQAPAREPCGVDDAEGLSDIFSVPGSRSIAPSA